MGVEQERCLLSWLCISLLFVAMAVEGKTMKDGVQDNVDKAAAKVPHHSTTRGMSIEAEQILLDVMAQLGLLHITGKPIPLYRLDLAEDYVAYWEIEVGDEYITISAGQSTGDQDLALEGPLPSPTSRLIEEAAKHDANCFQFYMLTPGGEMMCKDQDGRIVATTIPDYIIQEHKEEFGYPEDSQDLLAVLNAYIEAKESFLKHKWAQHALTVSKSFQKGETVEDEEDYDEYADDDDEVHTADDSVPDDFDALPVTPGEALKVALGEQGAVDSIHIKYMAFGEQDKMNIQAKLCSIVKGCVLISADYGEMSSDVIQTDPDTGLNYFELELSQDAGNILKRQDIIFAVEIYENGVVDIRHYGIEYEARRQKRRKEYRSWSAYTYTDIEMENLFPHYSQFDSGRCSVGCGPVAWAMVFGYLDRKAHSKGCSSSGSCGLYRSGSDGTDGSDSQVAPTTRDSRVTNYIEELNDVLKTVCLFGSGATYMGRMDRVGGFFADRQTVGSPVVVKKSYWFSFTGRYRSTIASWARDRIREGWPVIVGWRTGWLGGWHYPVATRFRTRSRSWRRCSGWFGCGSWKSETQYDMYLHMGWGGSSDGWYKMEAFYALAAKY